MQPSNGFLHVSMFCGGRGSTTITRELLRWPNVQLNLLVNAYDDGLSTGELRDFIPGMLGPSDFRKNLSHLLDLYSNQQHALQLVLEYRLPLNFTEQDRAALETYVADPRNARGLTPELRDLFSQLDHDLRDRLLVYLNRFFLYYRQSGKQFRFADCSLGNLLFAGAYLHHGRSFNSATKDLAQLFGSQARLINVSKGENRTLVALKEDGEILSREAEIVGPQSSNRMDSVYFLQAPLSAVEKEELGRLSFREKRAWLSSMEAQTEVSDEAREAILSSDIIIYGPGTQFSSLMPSYRVQGLGDAVRNSRARLKAMVMNLSADHDIQGMDVGDIVDKLLESFGDPGNERGHVTHILYNQNTAAGLNALALPERLATNGNRYKNAAIVQGDFNNPARPTVHSGYAVVRKVMDLLERKTTKRRQDTLDIYVDLLSRSIAFDSILQEFLELPWQQQFCKVRLHVNQLELPEVKLPQYLELRNTSFKGPFTEQSMLIDWMGKGDSEYLVTLTGDGEYRLRDIFAGITTLRGGPFGAVLGSRTQSRKQFASSLRSAYGEGTFLFWTSWLGAFLLTTMFALRFKVIFSDTLTGFRIYKHSKVHESLHQAMSKHPPRSSVDLTKVLVRNNIDVAEMPVSYRTFRGFTRVSWRMKHAFDTALSILR
jgi:2-phospho-L-lactate transferase/gluconeogenesis factor (CofD/UPF0052 family)